MGAEKSRAGVIRDLILRSELNPEHHKVATEDWRHGGQLGGYGSNSGVSGNKIAKMRIEKR